MRFDDSDIKIFTGGNSSSDDNNEVLKLAEESKRHRNNGNADKAKKIGVLLAEAAPKELNDPALKKFVGDPEILYEIKVLSVFTGESSAHIYMPNPILATTAVNALYDNLKAQFPGFYENITDGTAFSFYYLNLRRGIDVEENIGKTFAMLCEDENNQELMKLGETIYKELRDYACGEIEKAGFVE